MTFSYAGLLTSDLDRMRFYIGDTSNSTGAGVKPGGVNFTDEELTGLLTVEGSYQRAVAGAYEALAAMYANQVDLTLGPRREALSQAAERYTRLAEQWRKKHGYSQTGGSTAGARHPTRVDGYSSDIASNEV